MAVGVFVIVGVRVGVSVGRGVCVSVAVGGFFVGVLVFVGVADEVRVSVGVGVSGAPISITPKLLRTTTNPPNAESKVIISVMIPGNVAQNDGLLPPGFAMLPIHIRVLHAFNFHCQIIQQGSQISESFQCF